jgi:hypothetical protein
MAPCLSSYIRRRLTHQFAWKIENYNSWSVDLFTKYRRNLRSWRLRLTIHADEFFFFNLVWEQVSSEGLLPAFLKSQSRVMSYTMINRCQPKSTIFFNRRIYTPWLLGPFINFSIYFPPGVLQIRRWIATISPRHKSSYDIIARQVGTVRTAPMVDRGNVHRIRIFLRSQHGGVFSQWYTVWWHEHSSWRHVRNTLLHRASRWVNEMHGRPSNDIGTCLLWGKQVKYNFGHPRKFETLNFSKFSQNLLWHPIVTHAISTWQVVLRSPDFKGRFFVEGGPYLERRIRRESWPKKQRTRANHL